MSWEKQVPSGLKYEVKKVFDSRAMQYPLSNHNLYSHLKLHALPNGIQTTLQGLS